MHSKHLETIPVAIEKLQEERTQHKRVEAEKRRQEAEEKRKAMEEATKKIKEDEEHKIKSKLVEEETKKKLREERLRKREESRGDAFQESSELLVSFLKRVLVVIIRLAGLIVWLVQIQTN